MTLDTFSCMCLCVQTPPSPILSMALGIGAAFLFLSTPKSTLELSEVRNQNRTRYFQRHCRNESPNDTLEFSGYIPTVRFGYWLSLGNPTLFYSWVILKIQSKDTYRLPGPLVLSNGAVKNGLNLVHMQGNTCCRREHVTLQTSNISCLEASWSSHEVRTNGRGQVKGGRRPTGSGLGTGQKGDVGFFLFLFGSRRRKKNFFCPPVFVFLCFITDSTEVRSREALEDLWFWGEKEQ